MLKGFKPMPGADGWQISNVNILSTAAHLASLQIFEEAGIRSLRDKSVKLTGFLEFLLDQIVLERFDAFLRWRLVGRTFIAIERNEVDFASDRA